MDERQQLEQAIAVQESLRGTIDDAIIDAAIATLNEKLADLDPRQQRKLATILFTDIVGSTRLTRGMDPEEQMALIDPLIGRMAEKVDDHGGHVCRYQGDGFKAVFGLPVAHENDPQQAIRAGLAIQAEAARIAEDLEKEQGLAGFQVRVGISTGLVFSGGETEGEDTIKGEAVNLAARLESAAQPGTVLISHDSYKHVRGVFDFEPLDPIEVKEFSERVVVYRVLRAKQLSFYRGIRRVEGVETRMVGREPEFLQLQKVLRDVFEDRAAQIITVVGEAGLGKSRLMYEFENWADLQPEHFWLYKGRARLETQGAPYGLLRDLFAFRFGIRADDRAQAVRDKLENGFGEMFGTNAEGEKKAHIIGQLLGYDFQDSPHLRGILLHPEHLRDQAIMYLGSFFKSLAEKNPLLMLLEDLHWADEASLDALNALAFELINQPVMILTTARHGLLERRPNWGEGQDFHRRVLLEPLSKRESRKLAVEILQQVEDLPEALSELVVSHTEGNPFYVEELIKMLVEEGVIIRGEPHWWVKTSRLEEVQVPPTLTGVLQARLDGLPEEERKALQGASVVGRVFWDRILEYINGSLEDRITDKQVTELLDRLRSRELIFRRETSAFTEAREHIFKHALLREVTYESVLKRVRQACHALVAEWLVEHAGDRAGEFTGLIADHFEQAGRINQARQYLLQAGKQAAGKFANQEAVSYLSRALALTSDTDPEERYEILRERVRVNDVVGKRDAQEADLGALETLADKLADRQKQAETALLRAHYEAGISEYQRSLQTAQRAVSIAQEIGNLEQEAEGHLTLGRVLFLQYELNQAKRKLDKTLELAEKIDNQQIVGHALRYLGNIAYYQGDPELGIKYYLECLALSRKIGDRIGEAHVLNNLGGIYMAQLKLVQSADFLQAAIVLCREIGYKLNECIALGNLGDLHSILGDYQKAWKAYDQSLTINRQLKKHMSILQALDGLAWIAVFIHEDYPSARIFAEEGLSVARELGNLISEATFLKRLGDLQAGLLKWSEAEDSYEKSIEILIKIDLQEYRIYRWEGLAYLYLAQGLLDQAVQQVDLILDDLEVNGIKEMDIGVLYPLHVCCQVLQEANDSRFPEVVETTYNHLQNLAEKIANADWRNSFLNNVPWNREITELWQAEQEKTQGNQP